MDKLDLIYDLVNKVLAKGDAELAELREERLNEDVLTFYEIGVDEDGVPYSDGNVNDVYDDGYNNGITCGEYEFAEKILRILLGEEDVV